MNLKSKKGKMARRLVYFCIGILTAAAVWGATLKSISPSSDLSDVLTFVGAVFGGELLLLLCKRIFAKPNSEEEEHYE